MAVVKLNLSGHDNQKLRERGFSYLGALQVDLKDETLPQKITNILKEYVKSEDTVTICPPGLAPLALIVVTAIHGLSGHFPKCVALVKTDEGFIPSDNIIDLQEMRNSISRAERDDVIVV